MEQQTHRKHYAIEGGKERILKVKPKGGEWGNEFHRIFVLVFVIILVIGLYYFINETA